MIDPYRAYVSTTVPVLAGYALVLWIGSWRERNGSPSAALRRAHIVFRCLAIPIAISFVILDSVKQGFWDGALPTACGFAWLFCNRGSKRSERTVLSLDLNRPST